VPFDPTKSCPVIRNFECIQEDCAFWDTINAECIYYSMVKVKQDYNEMTGTLVSSGNFLVDLGMVFKNVTIVVSSPATVHFTAVTGPVITLSSTFGRVGVPNIWKGINARYVWINATTPPLTYLVAGDG